MIDRTFEITIPVSGGFVSGSSSWRIEFASIRKSIYEGFEIGSPSLPEIWNCYQSATFETVTTADRGLSFGILI
jgi:hypothetical protein